MCTSHYRDFTKCLETFYDNFGGKWSEYQNNPKYEVRKDSYQALKHDDGEIYQRVFMAWNLGKLKRLVKIGNVNAIEFFNERS